MSSLKSKNAEIALLQKEHAILLNALKKIKYIQEEIGHKYSTTCKLATEAITKMEQLCTK